MTAALTKSVSAGSTGSGTVTTAAADFTGSDLIVINVQAYPGAQSGTLTVSDSAGNTWTPLTAENISSFITLSSFYCASPTVSSSQTFTATYSNTSERPSITVLGFSGSAASPLDTQNGATTTGATSLQPGSITPAANGEIIVSTWGGYSVNQAPTVDSSLTIQEHVARSATAQPMSTAYLIQPTAAAINPTWSWATSDHAAVNIVAFTASGGGGFTAKQRRTLSPFGTRVGSRQAQAV